MDREAIQIMYPWKGSGKVANLTGPTEALDAAASTLSTVSRPRTTGRG
jgi:hypothetical protein